MKKLPLLLVLFFALASFAPQLQAQSTAVSDEDVVSPAESEINKLNFNLKMLKSMENREDWKNKSWVERYGKYVAKAESSLKAVQAKDPAYDVTEVSGKIVAKRKRLDETLAAINMDSEAAMDARNAKAQAEKDAAMENWKAEQAKKEKENNAAAASGQVGTSKGGPVYGERPEGTLMIWIRNQCTSKMQYCLDDGGSQTFVQIGPNEWSMKYVKPGTKIAQVTNNRCGTVVGTASKEEQEINLCR